MRTLLRVLLLWLYLVTCLAVIVGAGVLLVHLGGAGALAIAIPVTIAGLVAWATVTGEAAQKEEDAEWERKTRHMRIDLSRYGKGPEK